MSEMIRRVAKAIYEGRNGRGAVPLHHQLKTHQEPYLADARAALEALRKPTPEMLKAGDVPGWDDSVTVGHSAEVWDAMIDAALSPSGGK